MTDTELATWTAAGSFLDALGGRDFAALRDCLSPDVRMRALVPPGPFEEHGADAATARFVRWFGGDERFELLDAAVGNLGARLYLRWRLRLTDPATGAARVVEQHAFVDVTERIDRIDLLCSGFQPEHEPSLDRGAACPVRQ
jgi:hypothetical protein